MTTPKELPLSVAISALVKNGKILLIKRLRGDYVGMLGLPGGKIEKHEHMSAAATREILEESGIKSSFKRLLGLVSELLMEDNQVLQHFLLHVCELEPESTEILVDAEGALDWYALADLEALKGQIIPSDFLILEKLVKTQEKNYFECVLEKSGEEYLLKQFI